MVQQSATAMQGKLDGIYAITYNQEIKILVHTSPIYTS
jgi:hypothetical protein